MPQQFLCAWIQSQWTKTRIYFWVSEPLIALSRSIRIQNLRNLLLRRGSKGNFRFHRGSAPWLALKRKRSVQLAYPLPHIDQP